MVIKLLFRNLFQLFVEVILFSESALLILIKQEKLQGGLYPDGLIIGCIFLLACRWAYNRGGGL